MLSLSSQHTTIQPGANGTDAYALSGEEKSEVLDFLSIRPRHTFVMTGWIQDNGITSKFNRGNFYGYRDRTGTLKGVALIGHVTLFETDSERAMRSFAWLAQTCPTANVLMGEESKVTRLLSHYHSYGRTTPRLMCRELLFERRHKRADEGQLLDLRLAKADELDIVANAHADMMIEQTGVDPHKTDASGFRERCARRIKQRRVWVWTTGDQLIFKADVISDLTEVVYLEGVFVNPVKRGNGIGTRCVQQLTNMLLRRAKSVCLLVKEHDTVAKSCYQKAGYSFRDYYKTLYFAKTALTTN
jgi:ribosomal protein S18 acetylase RimI-like enzyme